MNAPIPTDVRKDAGDANAEEGQVLLDGPDGIAVALSPDAAQRTGQNLVAAAEVARGQEQPKDS
jgi:hypothetical protein